VSQSDGDNAIVLLPGANQSITVEAIKSCIFSKESTAKYLLLQNETSCVTDAILLGKEKGMTVVWNPAPCPADLSKRYPVDKVDILILNEHEATVLVVSLQQSTSSDGSLESSVTSLLQFYRGMSCVVITLGEKGVVGGVRTSNGDIRIYKMRALDNVKVVDTTGAGDTFVG
jgi:ribokinase